MSNQKEKGFFEKVANLLGVSLKDMEESKNNSTEKAKTQKGKSPNKEMLD